MDFRKKFRVKPGSKVDLSNWDPDDTGPIKSKVDAQEHLTHNAQRLGDLQYLLYAESKRALLIVLQAMDAGGKDGTIRHVMSAVNPQSCRITSFKQPSAEELAHDFLWRIHHAVPRKGEIGIFNRSHYEDVLVVRVHNLVPKDVWSQRYQQINEFERYLSDNNIHILKFFLHISRDEQRKRLRQRIDDPRKQWKIEPTDVQERKYWGQYVQAYEAALSRCSNKHAPWHIIPANHKWFRNLAVSQIIVDTLTEFGMKFPKPRVDLSKLKV